MLSVQLQQAIGVGLIVAALCCLAYCKGIDLFRD
jgi:hypothetical protein